MRGVYVSQSTYFMMTIHGLGVRLVEVDAAICYQQVLVL